MIRFSDKHNCCGCEACIQRCPKHCITPVRDDEGFLYPLVDEAACIDCGLCEKACPVINQQKPRRPLYAYAAINPDEDIRRNSSSGGVFTVLAENVIAEGGVVFGAMFNERWEVVHGQIENIGELDKLRGSKYVQSRIGTSYQAVETSLKAGRKVLFSGTSCQVAGLKKFLRKEYDQLFTVDVVCHGVPSPLLWKEYLASLDASAPIQSINMKDKTDGWMGYKMTIKGAQNTLSERASINKYLLAFSQNLSLRPSCYQCPAKSGKSGSDITLADYWGVEKLLPEMYDNKGTSFVCVNTLRGESALGRIDITMKLADYSLSVPYNSCLERSTKEPKERAAFWKQYKHNGIAALYALHPAKPNIIWRALRWIERRIR